jgi:RimJ/RimL family protein N-acetyltransferase
MTAEYAALNKALGEKIRMRTAGLALRPVQPADEPFLRRLNAEERSVAYDGLGLPSTLLEKLLECHLRAQADRIARQFPDAEHFIICFVDAPIGRLSLSLEHSQFGRCLRIVDIAVCADMRGRSLGRDVVGSIVAAARALRYGRVTLSVFAANEQAIKFFKKVGFRLKGGADEAQDMPMAFQLP